MGAVLALLLCQSNGVKLASVLPPMLICVIMGTIYSVYAFLHLHSMLQPGVPNLFVDAGKAERGRLQLYVSHVLVSLFLISYSRAIVTSPGSVPDTSEWRLGSPDGSALPETKEVKLTGERRHCKWCLKYKPDRCHHCRICKMCVLKMDHHCPWIMNCVGWGNHKFFFLVVVYAALTCAFMFVTLLESVQDCVYKEMPHFNRFLLVFGTMLSLIMGTLMTVFLSFHTWLMLKGMTTIEFCEKTTRGTTSKGPTYDNGTWENIRAVLGPEPLLWFLPIDYGRGDGIRHAATTVADAAAQDLCGPRVAMMSS